MLSAHENRRGSIDNCQRLRSVAWARRSSLFAAATRRPRANTEKSSIPTDTMRSTASRSLSYRTDGGAFGRAGPQNPPRRIGTGAACWLNVASARQFVEVTARIHPFMQHADDLDYAFLGDAIVENVNRSPDHPCAFCRASSIPNVEAANTWMKFRSGLGKQPFGLNRHLAHRGDEEGSISLPAFCAPPLGACRKDVGQIDLCGAREAKRAIRLAHVLRSGRRQTFEVAFEIGTIDLGEIAASERIGTSLDVGAEGFQLEAVFAPTLLKDAQGIADGFARILVLAGFDDLLNEGILLGCQADVPSRHLGLATIA